MDSNNCDNVTSRTAAVGSTILETSRGTDSQPDRTFTMTQVMNLLTGVTKQAAASAFTAVMSATVMPCDCYNFYLPLFDPDVVRSRHYIRDWCANVDETITSFQHLKLDGHSKRIRPDASDAEVIDTSLNRYLS